MKRRKFFQLEVELTVREFHIIHKCTQVSRKIAIVKFN